MAAPSPSTAATEAPGRVWEGVVEFMNFRWVQLGFTNHEISERCIWMYMDGDFEY